LADDHQNARSLAEGLAEVAGIDCDLSRVQTNIVYFRLKNMDAARFVAACCEQGLLGGAYGTDLVRFVTHYGISPADIQLALAICREALRAYPRGRTVFRAAGGDIQLSPAERRPSR